MFSRIHSAVCSGVEGKVVNVESDISRGLPGINIVGLASTLVMESRERIRSAIINSGMEYPHGRITVNLTPASLHKNGSCLDLPIAVGILTSSLLIDMAGIEEWGIIGELALDGRILRIDGVLPILLGLKNSGIRKAIIPDGNIEEAILVNGIDIYPVRDLRDCVELLTLSARDPDRLIPLDTDLCPEYTALREPDEELPDFADIHGQENAKRAIMIAVTGRHGLLMIGSPGCGKTMLAERIPAVMPPMTGEEMLETAAVYSAAGKEYKYFSNSFRRPFRHPHHTIGKAGLLGGGLIPVPGEITLSHNGVLFLDEVCEFDRSLIEALRLPLEERSIVHFRRGQAYRFPCDFQLVMAANPCPCGYFGDSDHICRCTEAQLASYRKKLSGPIMDRIDLRISMDKVSYSELSRKDESRNLSSADIRKSVAKGISFARQSGRKGFNALLTDRETDVYCRLGNEESSLMNSAYASLGMSPRSYRKTLKVARTIADLDGSEEIKCSHLSEALSYRIQEVINE